jgi:hypothetical protein
MRNNFMTESLISANKTFYFLWSFILYKLSKLSSKLYNNKAASRVRHHQVFQSVSAMASYLEQLECLTREISNSFPGNDILISQIITLVTTCPPTFTYIHDPYTTRITASLVNALISSLSTIDAKSFSPEDDEIPTIASAQVNAVSCFTSRLFYDTTLNRLAKWRPRWDDGCDNWPGGSASMRYNDSLDGFLHGLRVLHAQLSGNEAARTSHRSGLKARMKNAVKMVLIIERAEKIKESFPEFLVPLTRLAELVRRPATVLLLINALQVKGGYTYYIHISVPLGRDQTLDGCGR